MSYVLGEIAVVFFFLTGYMIVNLGILKMLPPVMMFNGSEGWGGKDEPFL